MFTTGVGLKTVDPASPICVITGTTGYLGSILKRWFEDRGWTVRNLDRRSESHPFRLGDDPPPHIFQDAAVFIHCSYDFNAHGWASIERINVQGSIRLFKQAQASGVPRCIFISSISAFEGCSSLYGQAKLAVENQVLKMKGGVVRPGLIYGPSFRGIFGNLSRLVEKFPILPLIGLTPQPMYLVHEQDLAEMIFRLSNDPAVDSYPSLYTVASPSPVFFADILRTLAAFHHKRIHFIPLPFSLVYAGLRFLEALGLRPRLRSDGLIGLMKSNPQIDFNAQSSFKFQLRQFSADALKEA